VTGSRLLRVTLAAVVALVVVGGGLAGLVVSLARAEDVAVADNESPAAVARWCADLGEAFRPVGPFRSFGDVADAALAGRLRRPAEDPPMRDLIAYRRWQERHGEYLASSYLGLLESTPRPIVFTSAALAVALTDAHAGRPIRDAGRARAVARSLDRFRTEHCR
jgi:hypothetical protein